MYKTKVVQVNKMCFKLRSLVSMILIGQGI